MLGVQVVAGGFRGHIGVNGRTEYLGTFETPELAHAAYLDAKTTLHPGYVESSGGPHTP